MTIQSDTSFRKKLLPWLVAIAFFMEMLDTTILNTATPVIAEAMRVLPLNMKSVLSSYTISLALFIPISSWVADRFGTRKVFSSAIALFTLGSLLCGLSQNIHVLVACRILQGCGGALMVPVGRLILVRSFARSELIRAMSFVSIPALIGPMLGPVAGGFIVHYLTWRMIFFVNIPVGLVGLYLIFRFLPDHKTEKRVPLDLKGLLLFGSSIALLSYILEIFGEHSLSLSEGIGLFGISIALLGYYIWHAKNMSDPILNLDLLRIRTLGVGALGNFLTRLGVGGLSFLLPLLYQVGMRFSPLQSGLLILPQSFSAMAFKMAMPHILDRFGYKRTLLWNTFLLGISILLFSLTGPQTPVWMILIEATLLGFLSSLQFTSMNTLVYADISEKETSQANTLVSTVQQMSMSFGVALASLLAVLFIPEPSTLSAEATLQGIHQSLLFSGVFTIGSTFVFKYLKATDGESVSRKKVEKDPL